MAYDDRTNREAVRAYSHSAVTEYIPRNKRLRKPSIASRVKRFLGLK
ncbi:MAG TPA: hypothetical protein VMC61_05370 [Methanocella sp.]|nr:hypothetical protein [Methanocella sp.]